MFRINPFIRVYDRGGVKALFNALNLNTLYLSQKVFKKMLIEPTSQILDENFIVSPDFNASKYFSENQPILKDNNIYIAYFLLTSVCNFKCKYCFVESRIRNHDNAYMSIDTAEKGIQLLKRNISNNPHITKIIFYGGEPLLNFDVMKYVVERTKELQMNVNYQIITNGSVLNPNIINFLKTHKIEIGISLDGLKDTNDKMRIDQNNKGTYDKIISTIETLSKNGIIPGISCTISTHNINKLDEIISVLEKYNIKGMGYNLPGENENVSIFKSELQEMVKSLLNTEDAIFEKRIFEDRVINRRLKSFVEKRIWLKDCGGYGHQIVITPKGQVGVCHGLWADEINKKENVYFDIDVDYIGQVNQLPAWQEWYNRTPFNMPQCWNCEAIGLCGGGCAQKPFLHTGSIWNIDEDICVLMKEVVPWLIWKYFDVRVKSEFEKYSNER